MDDLFLKAGRNIVETCSRLMPTETATIITDKETLKIGELVKLLADKITEKVNFHIIEDYSERPITFVPNRMKKDVEGSDVTYFAATGKAGELPKFRGPLTNLAVTHGREIHMVNIDETLMRTGMQADYYKIASLTFLIMGIAVKSKSARVTTPKGTNLNVTFSDKLSWVPNTGLIWHKGMWGNLPAGETFTCPENIEGTMVVDGTLGDHFCAKYGSLDETPVSIPIEKSRAVVNKIKCENQELLNEFKHYLQQDKNSNKVGEFACGTNISLKDLVYNLLQDEKFPGVHVAFGSPFPHETGADWNTKSHVDGVMKKCSLWFDDTIILEDGKFKEKELLTFN